MNIGERIRKKRKEQKLTQAELAKQVNVSSQVISNWERGYTTPDSEDVRNLAKALDVTTDFLHGLDKKNTTDKEDKSPIPEAVKAWLRADNLDDLSVNEQEDLAEDLADYFAMKRKRILEKKKRNT